MADLFTLVEKQIFLRLTTTAGTALYGSRVWQGQGNVRETAPYVVFFHVAGGPDNDHGLRAFSVVYQVECVAEDEAQARQGAGYIDDALNGQALPFEDGWTNYWIVAGKMRARTENTEKKQFYRAGFDFDIRGSK